MRCQVRLGAGRLRRNSGSLLAHMRSQVDMRLAGKAAGSALASFSAIVHGDAGPFTRSANFWGAGFVSSITGIAVSNSNSGDGQLFGTAITPRHVVFADHATPVDGTTLRFSDASSAITLRTTTAHVTVGGSVDVSVARLSSDLPAGIRPCKIVPPNFLSYFRMPRIPIVIFDQVRNGLVHDWLEIESPSNDARSGAPIDTKRLEFFEASVGGDSGGPWGVLIKDEFVLLCVQNNATGGTATGQSFSDPFYLLNDAINTAIAAVDGGSPTGYTVSNPNLSEF